MEKNCGYLCQRDPTYICGSILTRGCWHGGQVRSSLFSWKYLIIKYQELHHCRISPYISLTSVNCLDTIRTFLVYIKIELLVEIEPSLDNLWHLTIKYVIFEYSLGLTPKHKGLFRVGRICDGERSTPSTIILYTMGECSLLTMDPHYLTFVAEPCVVWQEFGKHYLFVFLFADYQKYKILNCEILFRLFQLLWNLRGTLAVALPSF